MRHQYNPRVTIIGKYRVDGPVSYTKAREVLTQQFEEEAPEGLKPWYVAQGFKMSDICGSYVYFVWSKDTDLVKIGLAKDVGARLSAMQTGSPIPLTLIGLIPGRQRVEERIHALFAEERRKGEWFARSSRLEDFLRQAECDPVYFDGTS